jgi:hypothetical protein
LIFPVTKYTPSIYVQHKYFKKYISVSIHTFAIRDRTLASLGFDDYDDETLFMKSFAVKKS